MKDVAVVRDVMKDALENVNDIIRTHDDVKKVINLKLRVVMPGFNKDLFTIDCKEKDGVIVPVKFTYIPPSQKENNNLTRPFPEMYKIRTKIRKYIKKEVKLQFEGTDSIIFDRTIESFLFNHGLSMYGNELTVSLDGLEGYVLALPELYSSINVNVNKTTIDEEGYALIEAGILLHIGVLGEFIGNKHLWLVALNRFMKEMVRQKVKRVAAKVRNIVGIHLEGVVDDPF